MEGARWQPCSYHNPNKKINEAEDQQPIPPAYRHLIYLYCHRPPPTPFYPYLLCLHKFPVSYQTELRSWQRNQALQDWTKNSVLRRQSHYWIGSEPSLAQAASSCYNPPPPQKNEVLLAPRGSDPQVEEQYIRGQVSWGVFAWGWGTGGIIQEWGLNRGKGTGGKRKVLKSRKLRTGEELQVSSRTAWRPEEVALVWAKLLEGWVIISQAQLGQGKGAQSRWLITINTCP